ncbi:MAG: hypothetical protein GX219_04590 [Tissierellia bacterium]|nr:hypothetical protein [Tissierellia bacterium]NLP47307.1 hypothetical protein [Candidatus Epulonipiscium sp.]
MKVTTVIEQTSKYKHRIEYRPESNSFVESEYISLMYDRKVKYPYGWIKESGTPPDKHLDIYIMTNKDFELGEEVKVEIIGLYYRLDSDHKFLGVLGDRGFRDYKELEVKEKEDLNRIYNGKHEGEAWFGREKAEEVLREYFMEHNNDIL